MIRICSYCGKYLGKKPPLKDKSETHGICDSCLEIQLQKIEARQKKKVKK